MAENISASQETLVTNWLLEENKALKEELQHTRWLIGSVHCSRRILDSESEPDSGPVSSFCTESTNRDSIIPIPSLCDPASFAGLREGGAESCEVIINGLLKNDVKPDEET